MQNEIISDWICICAAGQSILGEPIDDAMVQAAADNYDPRFYTAMIWPHHPWDETGGMLAREMYTQNLGRVAELKAEKEDGVLKLFGRYVPNEILLSLNRDKQKLFSSAEFNLNFQGSGMIYLEGVTATDIPASTYTERMQFTARGKNKDIARGGLQQLSLGKLTDLNEGMSRRPSMFDRLFSSNKKPQYLSQPDKPEEDPKMDELKQMIQALLDKLNAAQGAADGTSTDTVAEATAEVEAAAEDIVEIAEEVATLAEEVAANPEDEVVKEEFSAARADMKERVAAFSVGRRHFSTRLRRARAAFSAGRPRKPAPASAPAGDLQAQLGQLSQMLSAAMGKTTTARPGQAPAGSGETPVL